MDKIVYVTIEEKIDKIDLKNNYYYYDKIHQESIAVINNTKLPNKYLINKEGNTNKLNIKFPYGIGIFVKSRLQVVEGYIDKNNKEYNRKVGEERVTYSDFPLVYKIINTITKEVLEVIPTNKEEFDYKPLINELKDFLKGKDDVEIVSLVGNQLKIKVKMNLVAKYAGRVIELRKDLEIHKKGERLTIDKIELDTIEKGKGIKIYFDLGEESSVEEINDAPGNWKYETWLSKNIKIIY